MSVLKRILLTVGSAGVLIVAGEVSEGGAVNVGWAAVSSVGGGTAVWTFPLDGKGAVDEGYGGNANNVGGVCIE